jgi:hypothetical protein
MRVPSAAKNIRNAAARLLSAEPPPSVASSVVDPFALPPVDVAYDVESAERALALRGFAPSAAPGAPRFIGFDVETKPNFTKNVANVNAPALVQLANERGCVLVHLASMRGETPPTLRALCEDAGSIFVGNGVWSDMRDVDGAHGTKSRGYVDVGVIAQTFGHSRHGLKAMSARYGYDAEKPKSVQTSNWEKSPLEAKQIDYGAKDAALGLWVLKQLYAEYAGGEVSLEDWAMAFGNASQPKEAFRSARANAKTTPECVMKAFERFDQKNRELVKEAWLVRQMKKAQRVVKQMAEGALHPVSATHALMDILHAPKSKRKVVEWVGSGSKGGGLFEIELKLGSSVRARGEGRTVKAAKFEAARGAFAALKDGDAADATIWIKRELEHAWSQ